MDKGNKLEIATIAGGCFWCTEAVFLELKGVVSVVSGYIGGDTVNPTYKDICTGNTGHAEAIAIGFDPTVISFYELLEVFFATHDPTTLNRQGNDIGTQYRSEIFYHDEDQKEMALDFISILNSENIFGKGVVTRVSAASIFYPAEDYHSDYYSRNKEQSYCSFVIKPKMDKLHKVFKDRLKE